MDPLIGKKLGEYLIRQRLGSGGMATIYRADQPNLSRQVAIKVLPHSVGHSANFIERFRREATAVARLQHENILDIYTHGEQGGIYYIVMPLIENPHGTTLADYIKGRPLEAERIKNVTRQICEALNYAHSKKIIHRDVKPSNILVTPAQKYLLADFGIAKTLNVDQTLTATNARMGTLSYMSPEQISGGDLTPQSDIYSFGVVLFEMATGRRPFIGHSEEHFIKLHLLDAPPNPKKLNPRLSEAMARVILQALAKKPEDRFSSARSMAAALDDSVPTLLGKGTRYLADTKPVTPAVTAPNEAPAELLPQQPAAPAAVEADAFSTVPSIPPVKPALQPLSIPQPTPAVWADQGPASGPGYGKYFAGGIVITLIIAGLVGVLAWNIFGSRAEPGQENEVEPVAATPEIETIDTPAEPVSPAAPEPAAEVAQPSAGPADPDEGASLADSLPTPAEADGDPAVPPPAEEDSAAAEPVIPAAGPDLSGRLAIPLLYGNEPKVYITSTSGELQNIVGTARQPHFSPDGRQLLVNGDGGPDDKLRLSDPLGNGMVQIGDPGLGGHEHPFWAPDSSQVIYDDHTLDPQGWRIYYRTLDNTQGEGTLLYADVGPIFGQYPLWASNDRFIFRACNTWANLVGECGLWLMTGNGSTPIRLTDQLSHIPLDLSGETVVFVSSETGDWNIYRLDLTTKAIQQLTVDTAADGLPAISPDGRTVAFVSNRGGGLAMWKVDIAGHTAPSKLFDLPPDWGGVPEAAWADERMSWGAAN